MTSQPNVSASVEELVKAIFSATPSQRTRIAAVLNGAESETKEADRQETRLITISGAAKMLALGRNTVYSLVKTHRLETVEINGCRRITIRSINEFIDGKRPANAATAQIIKQSATRYAATKVRKAS